MDVRDVSTEERLIPGDLIATLAARTPALGPNPTDWPGLTFYRFTAPTTPQWDDVGALAICVVAQGRKAVTVDGVRHCYDQFHYFVMRRSMRFQAEIVQASVEKPYLSFVLQVDPSLVRRINADMIERAATTFHRPLPLDDRDAYVSPLDLDLLGAALRFVRGRGAGP